VPVAEHTAPIGEPPIPRLGPRALALAVSVPAAVLYLLLQPPSGDLAAATYRGDLFARAGFTLWDNGWYGGHYLPGYSLLAPALGALVGERLLLCLSTAAAACLFGVVARRAFSARGARIAAVSFAVGASVTMLSGRVAFTLGLAVALAALVALQRGRMSAALPLAALTSLASPVAGAFLALAGLACALSGNTRRGLATAAAATGPVLLLALAFPEGGWEPFAPSVFWPAFAGVATIALLLPRIAGDLRPHAARTLARGAWLYEAALLGAFVLRTPVGSNAARLGAMFAAPLAAGALWKRRRLALLLLAPALLYWQIETPINDLSALAGDRSVNASYYRPLLAELTHLARGVPLRVEVPMTGAHWEAAFLADQGPILLARGWERQLDTRDAALLYEDGEGPPTAAAYREWLYENGVSYVALPDVRLDFAGAAEGRLIARGVPYLREVWRSAHWRLFAVAGAPPLAAPVAAVGAVGPDSTTSAALLPLLRAVGPDSFTLALPRAGSYSVRVRFTPYWALTEGNGCVRAAPHGWTTVDARTAGTIRVGVDFAIGRLFDHAPRCR
jgi:hypothetical protein